MIKVGIFTQNLRQEFPRGVARVARAFAKELAQEPTLDVYAISPPTYHLGEMLTDAYPLGDFLQKRPLEKITFKKTMKYRFQKLSGRKPKKATEPEIDWTLMSLRRFDVLVSFELFEHIWDWPVETLPAKTICVIHDTIPLRIDEGPNARPDHFFRCCAKPVFRADRLVCVSKSSERDLLAFFPNAEGRTEVIYNGHDLETFGQRELPSAARNPEACRLLMVGDIDRRKNVQNVLRAIPTIKRILPLCSIELVIVGKNEHEAIFSHLMKVANELGTVKWVGYVPDKNIIDYYRSADVFLFPSLWEGFGIPVLEAMSAGVPVVCSDLSSLPEVGGAHVEYCDPYDPPSIAEAVVRVLKLSPEERQQRIGDARAWAATFTWERSAQQLTQIIRQLAASPKSMHAEAERLPNRGAENP